MKIEVKNSTVFLDGKKWGKKPSGFDWGQYILNVLFYTNRDGRKDYTLIKNGVDETQDFKKEVKEHYKDIPNTNLRDSFFKYARVT
jgi:hypothetical protein